ncbi:hypothetical protein DWX75_01620 [Mitsuokella sp. AF21-1AC]|nr:hypothetical protein DWX75_01620 [Mitsuokella sp. AF21-1AC]
MRSALRDVFRLQHAAKCDPTYCEQQRYFAACRGVLTSGAKSLSYWAPALRAIVARFQAEHIPPLKHLTVLPLGGSEGAGCLSLLLWRRWQPQAGG